MLTIRFEQNNDISAIREVNEQAFGQSGEAEVVDTLRESCIERIALVACQDDAIVGYILFTPVIIENNDQIQITGMGLAPLAILPQWQNQGIGSQLIKAGLEKIRQINAPFVIVLGYPEYYGRFGFIAASLYGIISEYDNIPDAAFMIYVFDEAKLQNIQGIAKYHPEWSSLV